jgi:hypothetical protein
MSERAELLERLHRHPDDFAATAALRLLDTDPNQTRARDDRASERLVRDGVSSFDRLRLWRSDRARASRGRRSVISRETRGS